MLKLNNLLNICVLPHDFFQNEEITEKSIIVIYNKSSNKLNFRAADSRKHLNLVVEESLIIRSSYIDINEKIINGIIYTKITNRLPFSFLFSEDLVTSQNRNFKITRPTELIKYLNIEIDKNLVHSYMKDWFLEQLAKNENDQWSLSKEIELSLNTIFHNLHQSNNIDKYIEEWKNLLIELKMIDYDVYFKGNNIV